MPRKGPVPKRPILADPKFNSKVLSRFINKVMLQGKKSVAERICYTALEIVETKSGRDPMDIFTQALGNAMPLVEVRPRRVGGATYQVPMQVNKVRQQTLSIRWILMAAREKKGRPMAIKLADELIAAYNRDGAAITRRENVHRMADANKAFAHFAW
jgi:small subunit ribosomal protein S7